MISTWCKVRTSYRETIRMASRNGSVAITNKVSQIHPIIAHEGSEGSKCIAPVSYLTNLKLNMKQIIFLEILKRKTSIMERSFF